MTITHAPLLDHLIAMTDDTGLIQHATQDIPNRATGYCTDDIARGLIVAVNATRVCPPDPINTRLVTTYLSFLHDSQTEDGWFHNFMGYDRTWQDRRGSPDSFGRAVWGLGYCMRFAPRASWRELARRLMLAALPHASNVEHLRSSAYAGLGLVHAVKAAPADRELLFTALKAIVEPIAEAYERTAVRDWPWCESMLTYDNARLPEILLRAGDVLNDSNWRDIGLRMMMFYVGVVIENGMFMPVGNDGWFPRGGVKARYGQQPLEAAAMIDAALAARAISGDVRYLQSAQIAFAWFSGANSAGVNLISNGGCCDGIDAGGANPNMGAESTLSYLLSAMAIAKPASARLQIVR